MALFAANDTKYDVFISYATKDNKWYKEFIDEFRDELIDKMSSSPRFGDLGDGRPKIFLDKESLPQNGDISEELQQAINQSMFLVLLVTRNYLKSEWCFNELQYFRKRFRNKIGHAIKRTFIMVVEQEALPTSEHPWPERQFDTELASRYIDFYVKSNQSEAGPLRSRPNGSVNSDYDHELRRMVKTMGERYSEVKKEPATISPKPSVERSKALIGVVTPDLTAARDKLRAMLDEKGITATTLEPDDLSDSSRIEKWQAGIDPSMVFIQLVSYAPTIYNAMNPTGHLGIQASQLGDLGERQPREMVWCHPADEPDVVTEAPAAAKPMATDYIETQLSNVSSCSSLNEVISRICGGGELADPRKVYIEGNKLDEDAVWELTEHLNQKWRQNYGHEQAMTFAPLGWDFGLAERAAECQGIILIYGKKQTIALEAQVNDINRVFDGLPYNQKRPRQWIALTRPDDADKGSLFWRTFSIDRDDEIERVVNDIHKAIATPA